MKSSPRITYTPRLDAAPEAELNTLAACFRFILDCHQRGQTMQERLDDAGREMGEDLDRHGEDASEDVIEGTEVRHDLTQVAPDEGVARRKEGRTYAKTGSATLKT